MRRIDWIIIHHSESPLSTTVEQIRDWHTWPKEMKDQTWRYKGKFYEKHPLGNNQITGNGWSDIGYHAVIEGDGTLRPGCSMDRVGAHAKGANKGSLGVCMVGDNTKPEQEWRLVQTATLEDLLGVWCALFSAKIRGHGEVGSTATECPGVSVKDLFPGFY